MRADLQPPTPFDQLTAFLPDLERHSRSVLRVSHEVTEMDCPHIQAIRMTLAQTQDALHSAVALLASRDQYSPAETVVTLADAKE